MRKSGPKNLMIVKFLSSITMPEKVSALLVSHSNVNSKRMENLKLLELNY